MEFVLEAAEVRRRLAFIRHLLNVAGEQASGPEPTRAAAVLTAHDAVELTLHLVADAVDAAVERNTNFLDYWSKIDKVVRPHGHEVGSRTSMDRLNRARVGLKHAGIMPAADEEAALVDRAHTFAEDLCERILGVELEALSLVPLVEHGKARQHLHRSEELVAEADYEAAIAQTALAFDWLMRAYEPQEDARHLLQPELSVFDSSSHLRLDQLDWRLARAWDHLLESVIDVSRAVRMIAVGVDYYDFVRFDQLSPVVVRNFDGDVDLADLPYEEGHPTKEEAGYCISFVVSAALRYQARFRDEPPTDS